MITLNNKQKEVLKLAFFGCSCESYSKYQCLQCRSIAHGFLETYKYEIKELEELGFIKIGGYSYLKKNEIVYRLYFHHSEDQS